MLRRHASATGAPVSLPIPIQLIIEQTFGLDILWEEIEEPPDYVILGGLEPGDRRIVLNLLHEGLFDQYIGPEHFTLAHELAHWVYDADNPNQFALDLGERPAERYCYHRDSPGLSEDLRIRELNANKLAAHLLLPGDLVRRADIGEVLRDLPGTANRWGVSSTTLRIRLQELGLIPEQNAAQPNLI